MSADGDGGPKLFSYTAGSTTGPENWAKLSPENKLCGEGKKQSPIDLVTKQAVPVPNLDSLARTYAATNATLINNGHEISVPCSISDAPAIFTFLILVDPSLVIRGLVLSLPHQSIIHQPVLYWRNYMQMKFEGKVGSITVNGKVYSFEKLHWHLPSEHTINGQR